jgi:hypothetical protein
MVLRMLFEKRVIEGVEGATEVGISNSFFGTKKILTSGEHGHPGRGKQYGEGEAMTADIELGGVGAVSARSFRETIDKGVIVVRLDVVYRLRRASRDAIWRTLKPAKNGGGVTFAKGIIEKSFPKIVSPERIGGLAHGVRKATAEAPWFGDQMQARLYIEKLSLDLLQKFYAEKFGEV